MKSFENNDHAFDSTSEINQLMESQFAVTTSKNIRRKNYFLINESETSGQFFRDIYLFISQISRTSHTSTRSLDGFFGRVSQMDNERNINSDDVSNRFMSAL